MGNCKHPFEVFIGGAAAGWPLAACVQQENKG